ncbi:MAG TPA: GGDEF domain-containing protein [Burkholderiales bacterium]|nr:GGDEF domain-containing protein [Burkholderiales bacterium]
MISLLAQGLVFAGALILAGALVPIRRLIVQLPPGPVRNRWYAMMALIMLFLIGYLGYASTFWNGHSKLLDLNVPGVFFLGACFVWLTATLSLRTAVDVMRINLLERETVTDPVTGVFNRRYLDRRLSKEVASARRYGLPLSILLLDIDHFKQINDRHGHQAGDRVLAALGEIVAGELREPDVLVRYGGEEFLVITPHTPLRDAADVAERLRKRIESHDFNLANAPGGIYRIKVTASIGVASLGDGVDTSERLVHNADANLYRAKQEGRNRVIAGTPGATMNT